ncbi:MAG: hypothetical protein J4F28_05925, partial [Nitrosopumilaceae archaeon]|nr:hypothetical protein [Nitrosopumilaceae archaeon]
AGLVMDGIAPYYDKPLTCGGYSGYGGSATRQRCQAHVLRESGAPAREHGKTFPGLLRCTTPWRGRAAMPRTRGATREAAPRWARGPWRRPRPPLQRGWGVRRGRG